ncbi:Uncharacterized protein Adt_30427 [Abeliophyllum distichum]|uniref:Transposase n=1 Tax=Abeliophyllum distichum TaxID=126358 RepID=A0ABD1RC47_9LAMI
MAAQTSTRCIEENFTVGFTESLSDGVSLEALNLEKVWQVNRKKPLPIAFDNVEHTMQPIENNAKYFTRLIGNQVKFTMPPCYPSWTEVPEEQLARLQLLRLPDKYQAVCAAVDRLVADRYRDYKLKVHNYLKEHGPSRPIQRAICRGLERSTKNKANRDKVKYSSVQGSKSFSTTCYDEIERDSETQQWPGIIESFQTFHTFRYGNWVNLQAAGDYVTFSDASVDERAIAKEVLGERRRHVRGVGLVSKGTSPSLDSTTASKAPQRTSNQFSRDPQNDDPRFVVYEPQLR